jgi:tripeptidyl-peptidase-1
MTALLTNERIAAGKAGLGFLNPLIYANPGAFNPLKTGAWSDFPVLNARVCT